MRRTALAIALMLGLAAPVAAQAPPPVPALPDAARVTTYSLSASTCACSVGFALYGSGTDVDQWIQVYINGVAKLSTDPTYGWALTSTTGSLASIPRPITNAILTFTSPQTASVIIAGAERPRRLSQFSENRGVPARDLNQVVTDQVATTRELWDKSNRSIVGQPGDVWLPLPAAATRASTLLGFDSSGNPTLLASSGGSGVFSPIMPPFTTWCNPSGITAAGVACNALTAALPLTIVGGSTTTGGGTITGNFYPVVDTTLGNSISIGVGALSRMTVNGGYNNIGIGAGSMGLAGGGGMTTAAIFNMGLGYQTLGVLTTGDRNTAIGQIALGALTTGTHNVAIGYGSGDQITTGSLNACIGYLTCGISGGGGLTSSNNTAIGANAGQSLTSATNSGGNVLVGVNAGTTITSGQNNIVVGQGSTTGITTTNGNVAIGGGITNLAGKTQTIQICDGGVPTGTCRYDWGVTTAATGTLAGPANVTGIVGTTGVKGTGTVPTGNTGTCSTGITVAGASTVGTWTSTAICGLAGTIILTAMPAMPTGYVCFMSDRTTAGVTITETATTTTSATFTVQALPTGSVATVANDILQYSCMGY